MSTLTLSGAINWFVYKISPEIQSHYITLSCWLAINISGSLKVNKLMTLHWFQLTAYPQSSKSSQLFLGTGWSLQVVFSVGS